MGKAASKQRKKTDHRDGSIDTPAHTARHRECSIAPAALVSLLTLVLYALSMYPGLPPGDAGELITAAHQLGVAHPPGYPLFVLLGKLFSTLIPVGSVAFRVNMMCVVCGAGAAGMLSAAATEWTGMSWAGAMAGLMFALSPNAWFYSTHAEVFALNNLLVCTLLFLFLRYSTSGNDAVAYAGAFVIGLGMTNQHTIILFALPLALCVLIKGKRTLGTTPGLVKLSLAALCGFLPPYIWLAVAGRYPVKYGWGDLSTFGGLISHILRREYGTFQLAEASIGVPKTMFGSRLLAYFSTELSELTVPGALLAMYGAYSSFNRELYAKQLLLTWGFYTLAFNYLANLPLDPLHLGIQVRFWLQPHAVLCCLAAVGAVELAAIGGCSSQKVSQRCKAHGIGVAVLGAAALLAALRWKDTTQHGNTVLADFVGHTLDTLPSNSLFLMSGDNLVNGVVYLQQAEHRRVDVVALPIHWVFGNSWWPKAQRSFFPQINWPDSGRTGLRSLIDVNWRKFEQQVFIYGFHPSDDMMDAGETADSKMNLTAWEEANWARLPRIDIATYPEWSWEAGLVQDMLMANFTHASFAIQHHRVLSRRKPIPKHTLKKHQIERIALLLEQVHTKASPKLPYLPDIVLTRAEAYVELASMSQHATDLLRQAHKFYRLYVQIENRSSDQIRAVVSQAHDTIKKLSVLVK